MKDFTFGAKKKTTLRLAEHLGEIGITRWVAFQQYMMLIETGKDVASLKEYGVKMARGFDNQSLSQMFKAHHDWVYGLSTIERGDDGYQLCFAIMTYENEEEESSEYEPDFLRKKLARYNKAGLMQGDVKREVENFISGVLRS